MTDTKTGRDAARASYELVLATRTAPAPALESAPGVETLRDPDGEVVAFILTSSDNRVMQIPGIATFACPQGGRRVSVAVEPRVSEAAVTGTFHKSVLPLLLYFSGQEVLHASAVRSPEGVVGFCGEAGTGKSTLAYGLGCRGFAMWADDALALDVSQRPCALLLAFDPRLRPQTERFFESSPFQPRSDRPAEGKTAPLAALAVIRRMTGGKDGVQIEQLRGGRAFDKVVRHAYRLGLGTDYARRKTLIEQYMTIVASVPVFEIRFRSGFRHFPSVLDHVAEWLDAELGRAA